MRPTIITSRQVLKVLSCLCLLAACAPVSQAPTPEPQSQAANETKVVIDGLADDWENYPLAGTDEVGDQVSGSPDIGEVRAFNNDRYFYLLLRLHQDGQVDHYDILMDVDGGEYDFQVSVWPRENRFLFADFPVAAEMQPIQGGQASQSEVIELKLPLSWLADQPVQNFFVQSFLGRRTGDEFPDLRAALTDELEVIGVASSQPAAPVEAQPCQGSSSSDYEGYSITLPGAQAEMLWRAQFVPWWVRIGPDGRVYAVGDGGDSIYELKPDGTLGIAFTCPGVQIETGLMASDGAFWFASRDGGRLYRVDPQGTVKILAQSGNRNLEAGPNGSVYALENGLERIQPDGTRTLITADLHERKFAIGPNGEIVALKDGKIMLVSESGEMKELASGYGPEPWLTFGPDGLLYVTHWNSVDVIDLQTGSVEPIAWLKNSGIGEAGDFAPDGRLLLYHPNTNVFAADLQAKTVEIYHQVISNSWAAAIHPDGKVYVAFGNKQPNGETIVYQVIDQRTLEALFSVPYGNETSMVFDSQGIGYLGVGDQRQGGMLFRFDPLQRSFEEFAKPDCYPMAMAVNPQDDRVWWDDCAHYASLDENGKKVFINGVPSTENSSMAVTAQGEFYAIVFYHRDDPGEVYRHKIFRLDDESSAWQEVTDITQSDPGISMAKLVACRNGNLYTVESLGSENLPINESSYNAVRRLESDGSLTLVGFGFGFDGQAVSCDFSDDKIVFTSGAGIFSLTIPD